MILHRYATREYLKACTAILAALAIIYFSTRFASYLADAAEGKVAADHIARMLTIKMLVSLKDLVPLSLYLGVFATGVRMQRDAEITAMSAAGAGPLVLLHSALAVSLVGAAGVAAITLYAEPRAEETLQQIKDQTENEATIAGVKAGRFKELSSGKRVFYAERVSADERRLERAFVQSRDGSELGILRSDDAFVETETKSNDRFAVFLDGTSYAGEPGSLDYVVTRFAKYALRIESRAPTDVSNQVNYMLTSDLVKYDAPGFHAELQWRIAAPIATVLLPLLGLLIGISSRQGNWHLGLLSAISLYFIYNNILGVAKTLLKKGILLPAIGLWAVHLTLIGLIVVVYVVKRRPLHPVLLWPRSARRSPLTDDI